MLTSLAAARALDQDDPLKHYRDQFAWPVDSDGARLLYLCGNSLGLQPHVAAERVREVLDDWARLGVNGHFDAARPWLSYHRAAAPLLARLLGCHDDEAVAMNTLTVNLNLMLVGFYRPTDKRWKILIEADAFPSDRYAVQSQIALAGRDAEAGIVEWHAGADGLDPAQLEALLAKHDDIALILLPGVQYLSGEVLDMARIARLAQQRDIVIGLDLAHAIGNVPMRLHDWGVDFAVFCTYKYLNAGPGAVGGAFVHRKHHDNGRRLHGWWGNAEATRFQMSQRFDPAPGVDVWQQSNPPILALAPVVASLELFAAAGIEALREKSRRLTGALRQRIEDTLANNISVATPAAPARQGCQLSLIVNRGPSDGRAVFERLEALGVVCDWREPDTIRVAPAPLYNSFEDAWHFVERLAQALK